MIRQNERKIIHNAPQHRGIILLRRRLLREVPKLMESGMESMVLLHIVLHQARLLRYSLNFGEQLAFLVFVVVLDAFVPAVAVEKEIFDVSGVGNVGSLVVDGVEGADEGVVYVGHSGGHCNAEMGGF